jgi:hypothetical protein
MSATLDQDCRKDHEDLASPPGWFPTEQQHRFLETRAGENYHPVRGARMGSHPAHESGFRQQRFGREATMTDHVARPSRVTHRDGGTPPEPLGLESS